jgi:hypothetical protein
MKYLVTTRNKDSYYALALKTRMELMQGAVAYIEKNRKAGKCKEVYFQNDLKGSVSIWDIDPGEESVGRLLDNPMYFYIDFEMRPLIEWDTALKAVTKFYKQAGKK